MRPGLAVCVLFAPLTPGFAADEPAANAPPGDSISAAKRDFDTIKAARDGTLQQKGDLPRLSVPEIQVDSPLTRSSRMTKEEEAKLKKKKKSDNWLLDAMDKKPEPRKGEARDANAKAEEMRLSLEAQKETEPGGFAVVATEPASPVEKDRKEIEPPPNPLNQFLAGWMTPQDYALLKPGLQSSNSPGGQQQINSLVSAPPPAEVAISSRGDIAGSMLGADRPMFAPAKQVDNPYLPALSDPVPLATFTPPLPPAVISPPLSPSPSIFTPPATPPPPPQSKIPDFAKPAIDDKYFKPLKRF